MRRNMTLAIVQFFVVVLVFISAGVANAQMKVACVGDSITALPSGWCGVLGTKLGSGYMTRTFGVSGTTLLKGTGGLGSYSASAQYKPSHDFAPNIVVIMLGTNDSMPRNWNAGKDHFVKDYEELIDSYTSLASKPTVFLNTAPPASNNNMFTISGMTIEKEINPLIKQVAMNKMCPLVDVWAALGGDPSKLGGGDGVHPGASGSMLIADAVAKAIMSPVVPGGGAGMGGSAGAAGGGAGGSANTSGAGGSANTSGAGGSANASGAGGINANTSGAGAGSANTSGSSGGKAGGNANNAGSSNTSGSASLAGAGGGANAAGNTGSAVNAIGVAGTSAPMVVAPARSDGGCRMAGNSTSNSLPTAVVLLLLGIVIRSRKRS